MRPSKQKESLNFSYVNSRIGGASCAATEESIHYERKTGRAFARADVLFLERRNGRMSERASERVRRVRILVSRRARSRVRPRVCFIIIIAVTRVYLYCVEKKWAGVCNVILHKQDQLIFMRTGERGSERARARRRYRRAVSRIIKIGQGKQTVTREPVR